jgi:chromosome segregation ATPase
MTARRAKAVPEERLADLYEAPLEAFTAERDKLVRDLRADGEPELAREVGALKKPTRPAWAVNQGVRADPRAAARLAEAGERLASAQGSVLQGKGRDQLRAAMAEEQAAVEAMLEAIRSGIAESGNLSNAVLDRARDTLAAVAGDAELRAEFTAGRVVRDRKAVGFGTAPVQASRGRAAKAPDRSAAERRRARQRESRAQRRLKAATKRVREAGQRLEKARRNVEAAEARLTEAEGDRRDSERELRDARAALGGIGKQH